MTPLSRDYLYLDLAEALGLPVLIVSRPGLGTINHTLMTISVLQERRIPISGVVINYAKNWKKGLAEATNPAVIESVSRVRVLGVMRNRGRDLDDIVGAL